MQVVVDGYEFDFPNALQLFRFDEKENISPHYHGVNALKAVDVMAEFKNFYLWVEIKCYTDEDIDRLNQEGDQRKDGDDYHTKSWLRNNLARKYRDTFVYRFAENKIDKPIVYACLLNFDNALKTYFRKELRSFIPCGIPNKRWKHKIIDSLIVISEEDWSRNEMLSSLGTCRKI